MAALYASKQPAGFTNHIRNVAIVGATGQQGSHIVRELLTTGKHTVTAISREDSTSAPTEGVKVAKVNYANPDSLVEALKGQDALIITMNVTAPKDTSSKLIEAAAKAGVPWILPDQWGVDNSNTQFGKEIFLGPEKEKNRKLIEEYGVSSWIAVGGGFWYEYSLSMKPGYGFDIQNREVTFFDQGEAKMDTSTWEQVARAVKGLLSLKVLPDDEQDKSVTLDRNFRNKFALLSSFCISQKDMFESLKRVTGTTDADWKIENENSSERYATAVKEMKEGNRLGFVKGLYTRSFYPEEPVLFEKYGGTVNEVLGLPKEDLDTCTRRAIERSNEAAKK